MNIDLVNRAADAYLADAEGATEARFAFMKGLWALQAELESTAPTHSAPDAETAREALVTGQPLFLVSPPAVSADAYRAAIARVVTHILEAAVLDETETNALAITDVPAAVTDSMVASAARDFSQFVGDVSTALQSVSKGGTPSKATLAFVLHTALVPFLAAASAASLEALGDIEWSIWGSGHCPVCGAAAALGRMSESTATQGAGRTLWCSRCHATWAYERIRCARCGSRKPDSLHYTYDEADPAHRVHLCDECHGYLKVTFENETDKPISMVVEEAASITLDAIALANGYTGAGADA